jgi:hypothetical protein
MRNFPARRSSELEVPANCSADFASELQIQSRTGIMTCQYSSDSKVRERTRGTWRELRNRRTGLNPTKNK